LATAGARNDTDFSAVWTEVLLPRRLLWRLRPLKSAQQTIDFEGSTMSSPEPAARHSHGDDKPEPQDGVEAIVPLIPIVLPVMGGVLIFLLAFIAVYMA